MCVLVCVCVFFVRVLCVVVECNVCAFCCVWFVVPLCVRLYVLVCLFGLACLARFVYLVCFFGSVCSVCWWLSPICVFWVRVLVLLMCVCYGCDFVCSWCTCVFARVVLYVFVRAIVCD